MLFSLGAVVSTPGALDVLQQNEQGAIEFLKRHVSGDWGDLSDGDKKENDYAVSRQIRILSAYHTKDNTKLWIITEADRSATTILLPSEY